MRELKYKVGQVVGSLEILEIKNSRQAPCGQWIKLYSIKCLFCAREKTMSTSTIKHAKSCGCRRYVRTHKPVGSGKKSPPGTEVWVNTLISIYKSNARKRNLNFELTYSDFKSLVISSCIFCGDAGDNILRKKGYAEFNYCGIDRIKNDIGYTKENCVSCCQFCNEAKNSWSLDTFLNKCEKIAKRRIENGESCYQMDLI